MCDTGLFYIHEVSGETGGSHAGFKTVTSVRATCLQCMRTLHASCRPELEMIDSGLILYCRVCGTRQAVPNSRFSGFLRGCMSV